MGRNVQNIPCSNNLLRRELARNILNISTKYWNGDLYVQCIST